MVNLEWYRSFIQVYRVGTVSGAAQVLHLTQPAVSQHIAALEAALGQVLFQRSPRRMLPTIEGKQLYTQTVAAIEQLESIRTRAAAIDAPSLIRLGTPQEFFAERILSQLPHSPNWLYRVQFGMAPDLIEQLCQNQLDLVIATQKIARSELNYQPIHQENFWLVAAPQTAPPVELTQWPVDLNSLEQWLRTQPLIAYSEELPIVRRFWRVVFGRRLEVVPRLVLPDLRMIRQAIVAGLGFSVLPDYLCEEMVNRKALAVLLKPANAVSNQIWLAYRKSDQQLPGIQLLLHLGDGLERGRDRSSTQSKIT